MNTAEFLHFVLPSQGIYFLAVPKNSGGFRQTPFNSTDKLASAALAASAKGKNAYFACSSFDKEEYADGDKIKQRTIDNALFARSQWLDIDCGRQYHGSQKEGLRALLDFCASTELPRPNVIINSGNGIHAYWVFDTDIPKEKWRRVSAAFKAIVAQKKFATDDTTRTADISSILRPPGTVNDKTGKGLGVKDVKLIGQVNTAPVVFKDWVAHLVRLRDALGVQVTAPVTANKPNINSDLGGEPDYPPSSALTIAEHCKQIAAFAESRGAEQTEPVWRSCIGVVKRCIEGDALAHLWSSGHADYDANECQAKLDHWTTGPTTCSKFRADNPPLCTGCAHDVTSPICLGHVAPVHETEITAVTESGETVTATLPEFPESVQKAFRVASGLLTAHTIDKTGVTRWVPICSSIPYVDAYFLDRDDHQWKFQISTYLRADMLRTATIPTGALGKGGSALMGILAAEALIVASPGKEKLLEIYMKNWIEAIVATSDETDVIGHMGWGEDGSFTAGHNKFMPDGSVRRVVLAESLRTTAAHYTPKGDFARYAVLVDTLYNRPDHQSYQFTWLAGFGSALFPLMEAGSAGIIISSYSTESGQGKSTAGKLAAGIWSNPHEVLDAKGTTSHALYLNAGMCHHVPLIIDELTPWTPEQLADHAYRYSTGRPRAQGKSDGGLRDNSDLSWTNFNIVNGNKSIQEAMAAHCGNTVPQIMRVWEYKFDVPHDGTLGVSEGRRVVSELMEMRGLAGERFAQYIVQHRAEITAALESTYSIFMQRTAMNKDGRYWGMAAACIWVAHKITQKLAMQKFDSPALQRWMIDQMLRMRGIAVASAVDMDSSFGDMMSELQVGFIVTDNEGDLRVKGEICKFAYGYGVPRGTVTGRVVLSTRKVVVSMSAVRDWCTYRGVSMSEIMEFLAGRGWIRNKRRHYLGKGTPIAIPQTMSMELDWNAFAGLLHTAPGGTEDITDSALMEVL